MQSFSFFFYSLWAVGVISGRVRALNLTVPLGSGRVGSDDLGYGPGSGFSFEPVQTSKEDQGDNKSCYCECLKELVHLRMSLWGLGTQGHTYSKGMILPITLRTIHFGLYWAVHKAN